MKVFLLPYDELPALYQKMQKDFPPQELKPLHRLQTLYQEGVYKPMVYQENGAIIAYACLYTAVTPMLLDYYAVDASFRSQGIGGRFLTHLLEEVGETLLAEVENPDYATDATQKEMRIRRRRFYEKLGFIDTHARVRIFDTPYCVYASCALTEDKALDAMEAIYSGLVPMDIPNRAMHIQIKKDPTQC